MGMGSAHVYIKEYDLSELVPNFRGVVGAIVIDSAKGPVNSKMLVTNEKQLVDYYGEPEPRKYGLGWYSAANFLKESDKLWTVRVDHGQLFSSALVRSKIDPVVEYDNYGYIMKDPIVDPIVKPNGPLSQHDIDSYQFIMYPRDREVEHFEPRIALVDKPNTGDTKLYVDNQAPVDVGDMITLKDTTGIEDRSEVMQWKIYTVISKEKELLYFDFIETDVDIIGVNYWDEIKAVRDYFVPTDPYSMVDVDATETDTSFLTKSLHPDFQIGDIISLDHANTKVYEITNLITQPMMDPYDSPIIVEGDQNTDYVETLDVVSQINAGDVVSIAGQTYNVIGVNSLSNPKTVTLDSNLPQLFTINAIQLNTPAIAEVQEFTVNTYSDATTYTVTVNGTDYSFTTTTGQTIEDIANGLVNEVTNDPNKEVNASNMGGGVFRLTATVSGNDLIVSVSDGDISVVEITPNQNPVARRDELIPNIYEDITYIVEVNGTNYEYTSVIGDDATSICNGLRTAMAGDQDVNVSGSNTLIVESNTPGINYTLVVEIKAEIKQQVDYREVVLDKALGYAVPAGNHVRRQVTHVTSYNYRCYAKKVDTENPRRLWVDSNDPIAENDMIEIANHKYTVTKKYQIQNYSNRLNLDSEYIDQTLSLIGDPVYEVVKADFEHHDAFLVYALTPGEWGNRIAIAITDSPNYEEAFFVEVYYDGVKVEEWEVSRKHMRDGYGRQLFLEDRINNSSSYIQVKDNPFMAWDEEDEEDGLGVEGDPIEPLKTLYYWRQPVSTPNYHKLAELKETVWEEDNYIRIGSTDIWKVDVTKPIMIGDKVYSIAMLQESAQGGVWDTVILEQMVALGKENLLPLERYLPIGDPVKQYFDRAREVEVQINTVMVGAEYTLTIKGTRVSHPYTYVYTYTAQAGDDITAIQQGLIDEIGENSQARVRGFIDQGSLIIKSQIAGVDFILETTSNMSQTELHNNAREWTHYPLQKISGSIMPLNHIGDVVTLLNQDYTIRDAGANRHTGGWDAEFPTVGQYLIALDEVFPDPEQVDYLVLLDGSITHRAYHQRMVEIVERRQDSVALLSMDWYAQTNPNIDKGVLAWRRELMINSSYGALYCPWTKVYDKFNDFEIWISPESWASRAISYISNNRELWYAPAGWNNGRVMALDVYRRYTKGERDILYDNQINPIRFAPNKGLVVWGQKTLQTKPSALDRLNVRLLLIVIERGVRDYLEYQVFKLNDAFTRRLITDAVTSFLADIKSRRGLYDFMVVCDETNNTPEVIDRNEMYVDIYLKPVRVAEFVTARVAVTRTGANFSEVLLTQ